MALAPKFSAFRLTFTGANSAAPGTAEPLHTVEMFLDYVCPFSASKAALPFAHPQSLPQLD